MKKQSFLTGAVILMIANAISKILGAVFKIPLTYILNEDGMAVFNIAFEVYIMFLSFIISGLPFAISKMVAESNSRGEYGKTHRIVKISTILLVCIGIVGSVALYFGSPFFALAMKEEKAIYAIQMIAPSIFFVALGTAYKSYYQGVSNMIPTALSQVTEAIVKLASGYYLAVLFLNYGVEKTAGGAIMGVTAGEIIATAILMIMYFCGRDKKYVKSEKSDTAEILKELMSIALSLLCASVVANAINVADTTLVRSRLLDGGFSSDEARFLYGAYTGYALTVFHLPVGILATLGVSILPVIAGAIAVNNTKKAQTATDIGIRLAVMLSMPCAVIMYLMSKEILTVLFHNSSSSAMLTAIAPCVVMMCVTPDNVRDITVGRENNAAVFNGTLRKCGKIICELVSYKAMPEINIYGSAISSSAAYILVMILNLIAIRKCLSLKLNITAVIIKPAIATALMFGVMYISSNCISAILGDGFVYLAVMCGIGMSAYVLMLFLTNAISVKEVRKILKG